MYDPERLDQLRSVSVLGINGGTVNHCLISLRRSVCPVVAASGKHLKTRIIVIWCGLNWQLYWTAQHTMDSL